MTPQIEIFSLSENAEVVAGKLNIRGAYLQFRTPSFPVKIETLCVSLRIRFGREDEGQHIIKLRAFESSGIPIGPPMELPCTVKAEEDAPFAWHLMVAKTRNVILKSPDDYRFELSIDGASIANSLLCVRGR
jgi:hypothetical protein